MPLSYILVEFAKEIGQSINTTAERANAISKINKAAKQLYDGKYDLVGCLREQVFNVDQTKLQVTLPYFVAQTRGVRHYDTRSRVKVEDMRPRYFYGREWPQKFLTWRKKNQVSICKDLDVEGPLTISIPQVESERFKVYIKGSTAEADGLVDVVVFEPGETEKTTALNFTKEPGFQVIAKDKIISNNVTLYDANGAEIAMIANSELESKYTLIAVSDYENAQTCECYELLYKKKFSPFFADYDVFPAPDYDDAIVYKACSHQYSKDSSDAAQKKVLEYEAKVNEILENKAFDGEGSDEKEIQFGRNPYFDLQGYGYPTGFSQDIPARIL